MYTYSGANYNTYFKRRIALRNTINESISLENQDIICKLMEGFFWEKNSLEKY